VLHWVTVLIRLSFATREAIAAGIRKSVGEVRAHDLNLRRLVMPAVRVCVEHSTEIYIGQAEGIDSNFEIQTEFRLDAGLGNVSSSPDR
jgi:hypothetical protein